MKNLMLSVATSALAISGCKTVVQPPSSLAKAGQHLTNRQICANEVRANTDRYKETRGYAISGIVGSAISEAIWKANAPAATLATVTVFTFIGYLIDEHNFNEAVRECLKTKEPLEYQQ